MDDRATGPASNAGPLRFQNDVWMVKNTLRAGCVQ